MSLLHQETGGISAQRVKDAINSGYDVSLDHVRIKGDLILSVAEEAKYDANRHDPTYTADKIAFEEPRRITSQINFSYCIFEGVVDFSNMIFCQEVSFDGSIFNEGVTFWSLSGYTPLKSAEFQKSASFHDAKFHKKADFNSVVFKEAAVFQEAVFYEDFNNVDFGCAKFYGDARFIASQFRVEARFLRAHFYGITTFSTATLFKKKADFRDAIFYNIVEFYSNNFEGDADFSSANFDRDAILSYSKFSGNLILKDTRIKIMKLDDITLASSSNILLKGSYFDRLIVDWSNIRTHLPAEGNDDSTYLALIKNFNDTGRPDDADDCKVQYKSKFKK